LIGLLGEVAHEIRQLVFCARHLVAQRFGQVLTQRLGLRAQVLLLAQRLLGFLDQVFQSRPLFGGTEAASLQNLEQLGKVVGQLALAGDGEAEPLAPQVLARFGQPRLDGQRLGLAAELFHRLREGDLSVPFRDDGHLVANHDPVVPDAVLSLGQAVEDVGAERVGVGGGQFDGAVLRGVDGLALVADDRPHLFEKVAQLAAILNADEFFGEAGDQFFLSADGQAQLIVLFGALDHLARGDEMFENGADFAPPNLVHALAGGRKILVLVARQKLVGLQIAHHVV